MDPSEGNHMTTLTIGTTDLARKKVYFALLYFSEGGPIGLLLIALPTLLREQAISIEMIAKFTSLLIIPWTLKFVWAPVIDTFKSPKLNYHTWMIVAQIMMGLTLIPLLFLDLKTDFDLCLKFLLLHTFFSSIQDIAIDSLAISITGPADYGKINGWMQVGQFLGRSVFGGGTILMLKYLAFNTVVSLLILVIFVIAFFAAQSKILKNAPAIYGTMNLNNLFINFKKALWRKSFFISLLLALTILSAEKGFTGLMGPFLLDRGFDKTTIGTFLAFPAIIIMIIGSLLGGYAADKFGKKVVLTFSTIFFILLLFSTVTLVPDQFLLGVLCLVYFMVGVTITTCTSLLMNVTDPVVAATQFSTLMGMINLCEAYSVYIIGKLSTLFNYPSAILVTCGISLISLVFLKFMKEERS
jgi:MFS transporter, PAT family, beta-lactamase induction signal transducer AmpG